MSKPQEKIPTLAEFEKLKKKENCRVCKLPVEIRGQIGKPASEKRIPQDHQIEWIKLATGTAITVEELKQHVSGRHDG